MNITLSISSLILIGLSILFGMYEVKKGQIKMHDNEIPIEKVTFKEDYVFYDLL